MITQPNNDKFKVQMQWEEQWWHLLGGHCILMTSFHLTWSRVLACVVPLFPWLLLLLMLEFLQGELFWSHKSCNCDHVVRVASISVQVVVFDFLITLVTEMISCWCGLSFVKRASFKDVQQALAPLIWTSGETQCMSRCFH